METTKGTRLHARRPTYPDANDRAADHFVKYLSSQKRSVMNDRYVRDLDQHSSQL